MILKTKDKKLLIKEMLVNSYKQYVLLNFMKFFKLISWIIIGYATFLIPIICLIIFFILISNNSEALNQVPDYLIYIISAITLFIPGMFYVTFKDDLIKRLSDLKSIYYQYGQNAYNIVTKNQPFVLYARNFGVERNLGNDGLTNKFDHFFKGRSFMQEEMDKQTNFSFLPWEVVRLFETSNYSIIGLGHENIERSIESVQLVFCKDIYWETVFFELAKKADFIIVNSIEKDGDHYLNIREGFLKEFYLILQNEELLNKTLVLHNDFEKGDSRYHSLNEMIKHSRWSSEFTLYNKNTHDFSMPEGELPKDFIKSVHHKSNDKTLSYKF